MKDNMKDAMKDEEVARRYLSYRVNPFRESYKTQE
jgi:hypothetical protein